MFAASADLAFGLQRPIAEHTNHICSENVPSAPHLRNLMMGSFFSVFTITNFRNSGQIVGNTPPYAPPHPPSPRVVLRCFFNSEKMTFLEIFDMYLVMFDIISQYFAIFVTILPLFAHYLPTICPLFLTPMLKITSHH